MRTAADLPETAAKALVRTAIDTAPPWARPSPVEGRLLELATENNEEEYVTCKECILWLRLRERAGDEAGMIDPEQGDFWYTYLLGTPAFSNARWQDWCLFIAQQAERQGFALSPRLLTAFIEHPTWVDAYLNAAILKALLAVEPVNPLTVLSPELSTGAFSVVDLQALRA